jgi:hypothetical protein
MSDDGVFHHVSELKGPGQIEKEAGDKEKTYSDPGLSVEGHGVGDLWLNVSTYPQIGGASLPASISDRDRFQGD